MFILKLFSVMYHKFCSVLIDTGASDGGLVVPVLSLPSEILSYHIKVMN